MINIVFAAVFMAVSLAAALGIAMLDNRPKPFIYTVGLASMLGQVVVLFAVLHLIGSPFGGPQARTLAGHDALGVFSL